MTAPTNKIDVRISMAKKHLTDAIERLNQINITGLSNKSLYLPGIAWMASDSVNFDIATKHLDIVMAQLKDMQK